MSTEVSTPGVLRLCPVTASVPTAKVGMVLGFMPNTMETHQNHLLWPAEPTAQKSDMETTHTDQNLETGVPGTGERGNGE